MSKIMLSMPTWLGGACSKRAYSGTNIVVIPHVFAEHSKRKFNDTLKYVHAETGFYERVTASFTESKRFVQNSYVTGVD